MSHVAGSFNISPQISQVGFDVVFVGTFRSHDSFHRWGAKFYLASFENGLWKLCTLYLRAPALVQLIPSLFWLENDEVLRPPRSPTHACHAGYFYTKQRRHGGY